MWICINPVLHFEETSLSMFSEKKSAIGKIKKLGCAVAWHTGKEESTTIRHLFQQLSIALAKGNAALFNNRNPSDSSEGDEGFGWWKYENI